MAREDGAIPSELGQHLVSIVRDESHLKLFGSSYATQVIDDLNPIQMLGLAVSKVASLATLHPFPWSRRSQASPF